MCRKLWIGLLWLGFLASLGAFPAGAVAGPLLQETPRPSAESQEPETEAPVVHVVQSGETLYEIAYQYGTTVEAIVAANQIADPSLISVGQRLIIPTTDLGQPPAAPVATLAPAIVLPGDSLFAVARRFDTALETVARQNGVLHPNRLPAGQTLLVENHPPVRVHVVVQGDTLVGLALRYGLPPWGLAEANDLDSPATLLPGQRLIVPSTQISQTNVSPTPTLPTPFQALEVSPLPAIQGHTLRVQVTLTGTAQVKGAFAGKALNLAQEEGSWYALIGVNAFAEPGVYPLALLATDSLGSEVYLSQDVEIADGDYGRETIDVPPDRENLLDPATVQAEWEWLQRFKTTYNPERYWEGLFLPPVENPEITSYFGTRRSYDGGPYSSFHSGTDYNGVTGDTVYAPAAGVVVAAQELTVRGNVIIIDHGWGIYTGYWHLSQIDVSVGQRVEPGDAIGLLGNTGLSTGAHLHWEFWVGGESVTALQWTEETFPR